MSASILGRVKWDLQQDSDYHRNYRIQWLAMTSSVADGPDIVLSASGLPAIGSYWAFGTGTDAWAFCSPEQRFTPIIEKEGNVYWTIDQLFTTKPLNRCGDTSITDPSIEPPHLSGSFVTYTREATKDRFGDPLRNSSYEQFRGAVVERDDSRPTVNVKLNSATLPLVTFASFMHTVNDSTLWGLDPRCVKLSNVSWERLLYGVCYYYYTISYEFAVKYDTWDRDILDEGSKVLAPGGTAGNPSHYIMYKDVNGENARVILDGTGHAWTGSGSPGYRHTEFYDESNLLLLGIPSSL